MIFYLYQTRSRMSPPWASDNPSHAGFYPGFHPMSGQIDLVGQVEVLTDSKLPPVERFQMSHAATLAYNRGLSSVTLGPLIDEPIFWPELRRVCRQSGFDPRFFFVYFSGNRPGYFAGFVPPVSIEFQSLAQLIQTKTRVAA